MNLNIVVPTEEDKIVFERVFIKSGITILVGNILDVAYDTIVSPANSHGFLDGGVDKYYQQYFGLELDNRVLDRIYEIGGILSIGQAMSIITKDEKIRRIIFAPTMEMPEAIPASNIFRAMLAALKTAGRLIPKVEHLYVPALGTGVGQVSFSDAAHEMYRAWEVFNLKYRNLIF